MSDPGVKLAVAQWITAISAVRQRGQTEGADAARPASEHRRIPSRDQRESTRAPASFHPGYFAEGLRFARSKLAGSSSLSTQAQLCHPLRLWLRFCASSVLLAALRLPGVQVHREEVAI